MSSSNPLTDLFQWASRNRILFSTVLGVGFLIIASPRPLSLAISIPIILLGEGVRVWASGNIVKNSRLSVEGPYSLSRNPLYVGNFFLGLGFVVAAWRWWLIPAYLFIFFGLYRHTIANEESFLEDRFKEQWRSYERSVPRYIPLLRWPEYSPGKFQWALVRKHRESNNWIVIVAVFGIFWAKSFLLN